MPHPARLLLLSVAVAATLAACQRAEDKAQAPAKATPAAVAPAVSNTPVGYDSKTPYATVKLTLPQAVKTTPALHAALYADMVRDLKQFEEVAQAEQLELLGGLGAGADIADIFELAPLRRAPAAHEIGQRIEARLAPDGGHEG